MDFSLSRKLISDKKGREILQGFSCIRKGFDLPLMFQSTCVKHLGRFLRHHFCIRTFQIDAKGLVFCSCLSFGSHYCSRRRRIDTKPTEHRERSICLQRIGLGIIRILPSLSKEQRCLKSLFFIQLESSLELKFKPKFLLETWYFERKRIFFQKEESRCYKSKFKSSPNRGGRVRDEPAPISTPTRQSD